MKVISYTLLVLAIPSVACVGGHAQEETDDDDDDWGAEADADTDADADADADADTDADTDADADTDLSEYIDTTELPSGDLGCYDGSSWNDVSVDPDCTDDNIVFGAVVTDFESGDAVADVTVSFSLADDPTGEPDFTVDSNSSGSLPLVEFASCTAFSTTAETDPALEETQTTIRQHWIYAGGSNVDAEVPSVSSTTFRLIPSLLGVSPDPSRGLLTGQVLDCDGEPVEGAQVVFRSPDGDIDTAQVVRYFVDEFPNRDQPTTSDDGLFIVIDAPVGQGRLEAWTWDGSNHVRQAMSDATCLAEAFTWSNLRVGLAHGVAVPPECEDC